MVSVSYTHLDVYKRQALILIWPLVTKLPFEVWAVWALTGVLAVVPPCAVNYANVAPTTATNNVATAITVNKIVFFLFSISTFPPLF